MSCKATIKRRGVVLTCGEYHHRKDEMPCHRCETDDGNVYWSDGDPDREQCPSLARYCAEELQCDSDGPDRCRNGHGAYSVRYGHIAWSEHKRPQPSVMFSSGGMGHRFGSYEADAMMTAAATMQDAANRLELVGCARPPAASTARPRQASRCGAGYPGRLRPPR